MDATTKLLLLALDLLAMSFLAHSHGDDVIIRTTDGDVRGLQTSVEGRPVSVYWGIPYATAPARFRRPERAQPWEGVLDALTPPPSCPEVPYPFDIALIPAATTRFDEDCLFLNLWVPTGCQALDGGGPGETLAAMVWIHGGGFEWGSTTVPTYDGRVLAATQCVIVASLNYRLGPLGFLSLSDDDRAPGNVGLLDQNMALRWIHQNLRSFGGSPDRITLFGESAGALSVGAHMVSPLSRDLFSRAIIQSGPPTEKWGQRTRSENVHNARELARIVGCAGGDDDDDSLITCLSALDGEELGRAVLKLPGFQNPGFGVIVDGYFLQEPIGNPFFRGDVKKFDIMLGLTKDDSSFVLPRLSAGPTPREGRPHMDRSAFHQLLTGFILRVLIDPPKDAPLASKLVEYLYVTSSLPRDRDGYHAALEKVILDLGMACPMYTTVASFLGGPKAAFMFSFDHRSSVTPFPEWMGVVHASELDLVFGRPLDQEELFTDQERRLSNVMMTAWANFAKFG